MQVHNRSLMFMAMFVLAAGCEGAASLPAQATGEADKVPLPAQAQGHEAGLLAHGWERVENPVTTSHAMPGEIAPAEGEIAAPELARRTLSDVAWQARDGRRYEALFVGEDGTAFGRAFAARDMATPDASKGYGAHDPRGALGRDGEPSDVRKAASDDTGSATAPPITGIILGGTLDSDRRARYSNIADLEAYPLRTVGSLSGSGNTMSGGCTGTMVGPRHVLTAAHCVMNASGSITTSGFFNPGQTNTTINNGGSSRRWSGVMLRDWRVHRRYDYALLYLEDRADNAALGWMGIAWWNGTSTYSGKLAYNKGYPCGPNMTCGTIDNQQCKASPRSDKRCDGWMYGDSATLHAGSATSDDRLEYNLDTSDGHSGSAIYTYLEGVPAVMAVHYGPNGSYNAGSRFRTSMWNDICTWIADVPSSHGSHALCH